MSHSSTTPLCSRAEIRFSLGFRQNRAKTIFPIFLPFAGCPGHCVFCAQDRQTGIKSAESSLGLVEALRAAERQLDALPRMEGGTSRELAFYGGTFTALPADQRQACLELLTRYRKRGVITCARCSTRPDAVEPSALAQLDQAGINLVELGVQSFNDSALAKSKRGYSGKEALAGCEAVLKANLDLGIQLLPGMPGVTPKVFLADVRTALSLKPACLRFYPCLVPEGTALAAMWRRGDFTPWPLGETVAALGEGLRLAWQAEVPVIRLSVAPERDFDAALLAGPRHPALGSLIQAEALKCAVEATLAAVGRQPTGLALPRACQGYVYGHKGKLKAWWTAQGLPPERIQYYDGAAQRNQEPPIGILSFR